MKTLMNSLAGFAMMIMGALTVVSCDPCSGVVCNNGTCSNGTCICEDGYERNNSSCVAVNKLYVGTGSVSATVVTVDAAGNSNTTNNVGYTLTASSTNPYEFTLVSFNGLVKNDITFMISSSNYEVISSGTIVTGAGNSYTYSGAKVGSQIQLTIIDSADQKTYTLSYVA
ncbi:MULTISPECIES: hypothetical protein [unclassified Aureispira]|uniref:hypothetical protein n=1 Tax=unclassified Aureispira TaxID=2649989 RepID=UPI0006974C50|nr:MULTISPECIES: hypothetical protein [unclassified Aureispira]WMX12588.1 hypothetical protein QP953_17295 [Aureispira sp. CCB-E]